jgi:protein-S-isoprenylcysteine O-methyltransferase Ste14
MSRSSKRKAALEAAPQPIAPLTADSPPKSDSNFALNLVGLLAGLIVILGLVRWSVAIDAWIGPLPHGMGTVSSNHLLVAMLGSAAVLLVIGSGELFWQRSYLNPSTGMATKALRPPDAGRVAVRLLGLALTLGIIALVYWLFPEYHGSFYDPFWGFLTTLAAPVGMLVVPYFIWTDMRLADPHDAYWQLGIVPLKLLRGEAIAGADVPDLAAHFRGWTVKSFFLPLMLNYLTNDTGQLGIYLPLRSFDSLNIYHFLFELSYTVDLLFCVIGYALTLRLFDSHIRSTEPTAFGWLIALLCYQPFWSVIGSTYLRYDDSIYFDNWPPVSTHPWLMTLWMAAIICMLFIYSLSTVSFGLRFSNLTYRGVITSGTYRITRHPAYLSKNLSWWLISVPWIPEHHWYEALRNCVLLGGLNLIYYLRARTEERHLSRDPAYVAYALWMNQHGLMAWLGRLFPILQYRPPAAGTAATPAAASARA